MNSEKFVKIAVLENEIEARLIQSILAESDLPHMLRSYHDTAYDGLYQFQMGWGELHAPPDLKQEIMQLIENIRNSSEPTSTSNGAS